jgi:hypothetical protein
LSTTSPLVCPKCGRSHHPEERFCSSCGMPLVAKGGEPIEAPLSEAHRRARKVDPRYTEGDLVRVARGENQAEAELIQGLLLEEGVPSIHRRSAAFDVPDFLAAGPRDILVPESGAEAAREVLMQTGMAPSPEAPWRPDPVKLTAGVVAAGAIGAGLIWVLERVSG